MKKFGLLSIIGCSVSGAEIPHITNVYVAQICLTGHAYPQDGKLKQQ